MILLPESLKLHAELKGMANRIAELAHMGEKTFSFDEMLGDGNMKAMMIQAVAEMLDRRDDLAEVRDNYLGITGQPDLTVIAKPHTGDEALLSACDSG